MPRARNLLLAALLAALLGGALLAGFVAGRRLPRPFAVRTLTKLGLMAPPASAWRPIEPAPFMVYEPASTTVGGQLYVFGGFKDSKIRATSAVWRYDPARRAWERRNDLPKPFTHANAVPLGDRVWFAGGFIGDSPGKATADVWRYDPRADQWAPGPPLPEPRGGGALVLLDGALHYIGGFTADQNNTGDHWVLRPAGPDSLRWVPAAALPVPRGHIAGAAVDGGILAIGGSIGHHIVTLDLAVVHRYDPILDRWTEVAPLPAPRSHFEPGTLVRDGRVIIVGGRSRPTDREVVTDVTEYDPRTDRWRALPSLPEPRHSPVASVTADGIIAGVGSSWTGSPVSSKFWRLDQERWAPMDTLPLPLGEVSAGVIGNRLYLVGEGSRVTLALDLGTGRWEEASRHAARPGWGNHHAAEVWNGRLYLFGGLTMGAGVTQIYDPVAEVWHLGPDIPFRAGSSASALIENKMYVVGGIIGDTTTRLAARFDPVAETWTPIAPMPRARNHAASATDGRRMFIFGGRGPGSGDANVVANGFADVQIYDPVTDTWTASGDGPSAPAPLPQARGGTGKAVYVNGEFWVFGGETIDGAGAGSSGTYDRVDIYDPVANRWRSGPPMPTARHGMFPVLDEGRILLLGGGTHAGHSQSKVAEILWLPRPD